MVEDKKVLVATPIFDGMKYCFNDFITRVQEIFYPADILIVDNSRTKGFFRELKKIPRIKVIYDETKEEKNMLRLISSRNKILSYARENSYDYLLMLDCDVLVPPNVLDALLSCGKEIVSGLYFNFFNIGGKAVVRPVCYTTVSTEIFQQFKEKNPDSTIKGKEELKRHITKEEIESGKLLEVKYPSAGCLLLSRLAINSGARYGLLDIKDGHTSDDIFFFDELRKAGFSLFCNPNIICKHVPLQKYVSGMHPAYK